VWACCDCRRVFFIILVFNLKHVNNLFTNYSTRVSWIYDFFFIFILYFMKRVYPGVTCCMYVY